MVSIPRQRGVLAVAVGVSAVLLASGCSKSASTNSTPAGGSSNATGGAQQVASSAPTTGGGCTYTKYGAPKLDLKSVTVGFSQSEATSNPFRATETKSITDEAAKEGIKLIQRNANANVAQQNTDIENMIAQGAKVLIVAPENSDGLAPALAQAKAKHIPMLTIDRTVTGTACSDFIGFIGSDFTGQAKIAADDLGAALGGKGNVAILQGTSGNNVAAGAHRRLRQRAEGQVPEHQGRRVADRQLRPGHRPEGHRADPAEQQGPGRHLRRERRHGLRCHPGHPGRRQDSGQGHQDRLHRRHPAGGAGRRGRHHGVRHRDQPAVRPAGLPDPDRLLRRQGRLRTR